MGGDAKFILLQSLVVLIEIVFFSGGRLVFSSSDLAKEA